MSKAPSPASVKTLTEMHHRKSHLCTNTGLHEVRILILTFLECNLASGYPMFAHHTPP